MHTGGPGFDHCLHQFEGVQHAAKAGLRVRDDGHEPVHRVIPFRMVEFVGALERVVDTADNGGYRVDRIQALIRIHAECVIGVRGYLPPGKIDRLEARLGHLHCLIAGQGPQGVYEIRFVQAAPQFFCAQPGQGMFDLYRPAQSNDVGRGVVSLNSLPARILRPVLF